jgi:hypothetical protein
LLPLAHYEVIHVSHPYRELTTRIQEQEFKSEFCRLRMARAIFFVIVLLCAYTVTGAVCYGTKACACGGSVCPHQSCPKKKSCPCGPDVCPGKPCFPFKNCECGPGVCPEEECPKKEPCKCGPPVCPGQKCQQLEKETNWCNKPIYVCPGEKYPERVDCPCFTDLNHPTYCPSVPGDKEFCPSYKCKCNIGPGSGCGIGDCLDFELMCPCNPDKCVYEHLRDFDCFKSCGAPDIGL